MTTNKEVWAAVFANELGNFKKRDDELWAEVLKMRSEVTDVTSCYRTLETRQFRFAAEQADYVVAALARIRKKNKSKKK